MYLDVNDLTSKVFVTSGLGGMSGAQAKVRTYDLKYINNVNLIKRLSQYKIHIYFFERQQSFVDALESLPRSAMRP